MRIALLSDIHGNITALDAVLADIASQGGVDEYWILGDLVAVGPSPVAVLDRIHALDNARCIRGNTDTYTCTDKRPPPTFADVRENPAKLPQLSQAAHGFGWTRGAVTQGGYFDWLSQLPLTIATTLPDGTRVLGCHASPYSEDGLGFHRDLSPTDLTTVIGDADADLFFGGHHHLTLDVDIGGRRVVNLGSLSNHVLPEIYASYVVLEADATSHHLEHCRVDYDCEIVIREMARVHYPGAEFVSRYLRGEHPGMGKEGLPAAVQEFKAQRAIIDPPTPGANP